MGSLLNVIAGGYDPYRVPAEQAQTAETQARVPLIQAQVPLTQAQTQEAQARVPLTIEQANQARTANLLQQQKLTDLATIRKQMQATADPQTGEIDMSKALKAAAPNISPDTLMSMQGNLADVQDKVAQYHDRLATAAQKGEDLAKLQRDHLADIAQDIAAHGYDPDYFHISLLAHEAREPQYRGDYDKLLAQTAPTTDAVKALLDPYVGAAGRKTPTYQAGLAKTQGETQKDVADAALATVQKQQREAELAAMKGDWDKAGVSLDPDLKTLYSAAVGNAANYADKRSALDKALAEQAQRNTFRLQEPARKAQTLAIAAAERVPRELQSSYTQNNGELDKLGTPIDSAATKLGELKTILTEGENGNPEAFALLAPKLLTVVAGGAGSGVRITQPELNSVIGGAGKWQELEGLFKQWSTDQASEVRSIVNLIDQKLQAKQAVMDKARQSLIDAPDVKTHRQIVLDTRQKLNQIEAASGQSPAGKARTDIPANIASGIAERQTRTVNSPTGTIKLRKQGGQLYEVQ